MSHMQTLLRYWVHCWRTPA